MAPVAAAGAGRFMVLASFNRTMQVNMLSPCSRRFMVLASDGVWEFLSSNEVAEMVERCHGDADKVMERGCARACVPDPRLHSAGAMEG